MKSIVHFCFRRAPRSLAAVAAILIGLVYAAMPASGTTLSDQPPFAGANVPGNLALALSVEFPTAISISNLYDYGDAKEYLGYFDPQKCYTYIFDPVTPSNSYFQPAAKSSGTFLHQCSGQWSGNFMNWATMPTIDPFRWALTGGYRSVDTIGQTILEKAWGPSTQGSANSNFPYRGSQRSGGNNLPNGLISAVTPFTTWADFDSGIWGNGNTMVFSAGSGYNSATTSSNVSDLVSVSTADTASASLATYRVYVRVKVCDVTFMGKAGLEGNCVPYPAAPATPISYKPEGLMQKYSNKIRYAAFGYLNQNGKDRQGGVLREPMGYIGPTYPTPLSATVTVNTRPEWDSATGIMTVNPDALSATASGVSQSGAMNYLNKFGESAHNYMTYDNVSELYYAALRYYENLGNVNEWSNSLTPAELDGFPAVTTWTGINAATGLSNDPILYSCQKNFILGIGDDHTWYDYNVGGATDTSGGRAKPSTVAADTLNQATQWTKNLQTLEGITPTPWWPFDSGATYYIAGLAYGAHVTDIRPDLDPVPQTSPPTIHTISTFWMDVAEDQEVENLNPYYLAAKYGGFSVPAGYSMSSTTPLALTSFDASGATILMNGNNTHPLPDNYFEGNNAQAMVSGLNSAFKNIASAITFASTSFSFSAAQVGSGTTSFGAAYDSTGWIGTVAASSLTFNSNGDPTTTTIWKSSNTLQTQFAGTGWQTARRVVTWDGTKGVPFEITNLPAETIALTPLSYAPTVTAAQYLNYLRGDQSNEVGSTATPSTKSLRARTLLLGDIVDATLVPVTTPSEKFSETTNLGYAKFKANNASRPTVVYAGANDGMLHAFDGASGIERFAYVPSALFQGPNGTPQVDGLAELGNPNYVHHFYVDATPLNFDVDFNNTSGNMTTTTPGNSGWRTLLIGGLGKGGKSFYALDVTTPLTNTDTESAIANNVLWEISSTDSGFSTLGYSFGAPVVVKTAKYGWVVAVTSGYNNSDGYGHLFLVNPRSGALLESIKTPTPSNGMTQAAAYVKDYSDYTADSVYVGDLNGQLWRFDLTATSGPYPAPIQLATLQDANGNAQPITTAPLIEIHPTTRKRYVMVGTGQLLSSLDVIWPNSVSPSYQSFYVIIDGNAGAFNPPPATPITRALLSPVTPSGLVATTSVLPGNSKGWYIDLGANSSGIGYRVVINSKAYNGMAAFATLSTTGDACNPKGTGQAYVVDYSAAISVERSSSGAIQPFQSFASSVINLKFIGVGSGGNGSNSSELIAGLADGGVYKVPFTQGNGLGVRLLNWLELPTAN